jgi:hypothetical protein
VSTPSLLTASMYADRKQMVWDKISIENGFEQDMLVLVGNLTYSSQSNGCPWKA